jgi:hypothetical protein
MANGQRSLFVGEEFLESPAMAGEQSCGLRQELAPDRSEIALERHPVFFGRKPYQVPMAGFTMARPRKKHAFRRLPDHERPFEVLLNTRAFLRTRCLDVAEQAMTPEMPSSHPIPDFHRAIQTRRLWPMTYQDTQIFRGSQRNMMASEIWRESVSDLRMPKTLK